MSKKAKSAHELFFTFFKIIFCVCFRKQNPSDSDGTKYSFPDHKQRNFLSRYVFLHQVFTSYILS